MIRMNQYGWMWTFERLQCLVTLPIVFPSIGKISITAKLLLGMLSVYAAKFWIQLPVLFSSFSKNSCVFNSGKCLYFWAFLP